ncbi:MAG: hypothetical protein HYZ47_01065 [Simkania negevensis]|nr:hypothetical protein [Simkania negevensis]
MRKNFKTFLFLLLLTLSKIYGDSFSWSLPATNLFPPIPASHEIFDLRLSIDPSGDGIAIWIDQTSPSVSVTRAASYHHATNSWDPPVTISDPLSVTSSCQVSVDSSGDAIALWFSASPAPFIATARTYNKATGQWRNDTTALSSASSGFTGINNCQIGTDALGNGIAIWEELLPPSTIQVVQSANYNKATQTWSPLPSSPSFPRYLTPTNSYVATNSSLSINAKGDAVAIWSNNASGNYSIEATVYTKATNTWSAPTQVKLINGPLSSDPSPQIAIDAAGNALAVWRNHITDTIEESTYTRALNTWSSINTLSSAGGTPVGVQVAVNEAGNGVAVWQQTIAGTSTIQSSQYNKSTNMWSSPSLQLSDPLESLSPQVAIDPAGNIVAVWQEVSGGIPVINAANFNSETLSWSAPQGLSFSGIGQAGLIPVVKMGNVGIVLAIWAQSDTSASTITVQSAASILVPPPPSNLSGYQKFNRFPTQSEFFNQLQWSPSSSSLLDHYNIFRNGVFIGSTPSSKPKFRDHNRVPGTSDTYSVTAVNTLGASSTPITITIP